MKSLFALVPLFAAAVGFAAEPTTQPATQPTTQSAHVQDASYGVGYSFGRNIAGSPVKLDTQRLLQGLHDALEGKPAAVDERTVNAAIMRLQQEAMVAEMAAATAAGDAFRAENAKKEGVTTTASGLQIEHTKVGTGESPKETSSRSTTPAR